MVVEKLLGKSEDYLDFGDTPFGIEDLVPLNNPGYFIAVPFFTPSRLRSYLLAASLTYNLGNTSIDYVLKKYVTQVFPDKDEITLKKPTLDRKITEIIKIETRKALKRIWGKLEETNLGRTIANAALLRLQSTFRTNIFLIHNGFHFESQSLSRMIAEQLAWIYTIYQLDNNEILKIEPQKCISKMKDIFPGYGKLYGGLSQSTHMTSDSLFRYLRKDKNNSLSIYLTMPEYRFYDALILLSLADVYMVMTELIHAKNLNKLIYTKILKNKIIPKKTRAMSKVLKKYNKLVEKESAKFSDEEN